MSAQIYFSPFVPLFNSSGVIVPGGKLTFYLTGTLTKTPIYSDASLSAILPNPITADQAGRFPDIYLNSAVTYRIRATDAKGAQLGNDIDPYIPGTAIAGPAGPAGPQGVPGTNGGVGSSAGLSALFTAASGMVIGAGITRFTTSGYSTAGIGGADYIYDAAVDAAYVTAHPRTSFLAAINVPEVTGRGFRLDMLQPLYIEMVGGKCDYTLTNFDYSSFTNSITITGSPTDNSAALIELMNLATLRPVGVVNNSGPMIPIMFQGVGDATKGYYFGSTIAPPCSVYLKGTGSGAVDYAGSGTAFQFPANTVGITLNTFATNPPGYPPGGIGAGSSIIEGISFFGGGGTDRTKHGLWQRAGATIKNCFFANFSGNNTHNVASTAVYPSDNYGLTSGTLWENVSCQNAGNWNTYCDGGDASASTFINLRHKSSRLGGLHDSSSFNNCYIGYQNNEHSNLGLGACWYGGRNYALISEVAGIGASTTPGTDDAIWHDWGAAGAASTRYPAWSSAGSYELSLPIFAGGEGTVFLSAYIENYYLPAHVPSPAQYIGGFPHVTRSTAIIEASGLSFNSSNGWRQIRSYAPGLSAALGTQMTAGIGGTDNVIWHHGRQAEDNLSAEYNLSYDGFDIRYGYALPGMGAAAVYYTTGINTTVTFGRSAPVRWVFAPTLLGIGDGSGNLVNSRICVTGTAAPTTGSHGQGEIVFNRAAASGEPMGWMCVTAGTPGTWKAMANLA